MNDNKNKYFAFISYKREDEELAIWFHHELENYHLPMTLKGRDDLPTTFRPVFRDVDELKAGNLPEQIYNALAASTYLIVICSPHSATSDWVNKEILDFINIGKIKGVDNVKNIFPFIVDGTPHSKNKSEECFPQALLELPKNLERIGGNVHESGRDKAFVKIMAGMLPNVAFDELWNRYEHEKAEKERKEREEREKFLRIQSRLVGEKAITIQNNTSFAQRVALEVLPEDLSNPNRPLTIEAERALRQSSVHCKIICKGHQLDIYDIAFTSDGKQMASISSDSTIKIWDTTTGTLLSTIPSRHSFGECITYSPDDKVLLAIYGDETMVFWDLKTKRAINYLDLSEIPNIPKGIHLIACDNSLKNVALVEFGGVHVISLLTDQLFSFEVNNPKSIAFSPDGRYLVSTSADGINFWDFEERDTATINLSHGVEPSVSQIAFSSDGKRVVFVFDNVVGLLEIADGSKIRTFGESDTLYVGVSFCNEDKCIATVSAEGILIIWDLNTLTEVSADYEEIHGVFFNDISKVVFSSKGNLVGVVSEGYNIVVKSVISPFVYKIFKESNQRIGDISYSPDGKYLVAANREEPFDLSIWDIENEKIVHKLSGHSDSVFSVAYGYEGDFVASSSYDSTIRIWDTGTGNCIKIFDARSIDKDRSHAPVGAVALSPNNEYIVGGLYSGEVVIWDFKSKDIVHILNNSLPIRNISFSPKGDKIVVGGVYQEAKVWDIQSGDVVLTLKGHTKCINSVIYTPDGSHILSVSDDNTIICWDAETGDRVWQVLNIDRPITSIAVNNEGTYVVAVSEDANYPLFICDLKTGKILVSYHGMFIQAESVAFSPNGRHIVSGGIDGTIIVWDFPPLQELIDNTCEHYKNKPLTHEEKVMYYLE